MKRYTFTVKEHPEYGGMGFAPTWYPQGDPLGGMAVAHDILEHFPKDDGSAEGEYQALGAALWIRGETGYMQRNGNVNSMEVHLAADFPTIWGIQSRVRDCQLVRDTDLMETCREIVRLGSKTIREEFGQDGPTPHEREHMARWMARGYKRAARRYGSAAYRNRGITAYEIAYQVFQKIEEDADKYLKGAEEGMVLNVWINLRQLDTRISLDYPEHPEEY